MRQIIKFRKKDHALFLCFWKKLEPRLSGLKNVVLQNFSEVLELSYEVSSRSSTLTSRVIKVWLADAIVLYFKEEYLFKWLKLPCKNSNLTDRALVKALTIFDKATDVDFVIDTMGTIKDFDVYSFYVFKMGALRTRWQEICNLFSRNLPSLVNSDVFIELMKYLLMTSDGGPVSVSLSMEKGRLNIRDHNEVLLVEPIDINDSTGETNAILELISIAPQNILIKFDKNLSPRLVCSINNLFEAKVVFCT